LGAIGVASTGCVVDVAGAVAKIGAAVGAVITGCIVGRILGRERTWA
jgi:hypothetical protein